MRSFIRLFSVAGIIGIFCALAFAFNGAVAFDPDAACVGNAKLLVRAIQQYEEANDGFLPPTVPSNAFRKALSPYVSSEKIFVCPATHSYYAPNPAISGIFRDYAPNGSATVLFQDAVPHSDGKSTVAYADGLVLHGGQRPVNLEVSCVRQSRQLALAVMNYTLDYDERFPPMKSAAAFEAAMYPYVSSRSEFICPATLAHYKPNPALQGKFIFDVQDPGSTILFSDSQKHPNGSSIVTYVSGNARLYRHAMPPMETGLPLAQTCVASETKLVGALLQYAQVNDETFPIFTNQTQAATALRPYLEGAAGPLKCPYTFTDYTINPGLSGLTLGAIADPSTLWAIKDNTIDRDGAINIIMMNGRVVAPDYWLPSNLSVLSDNRVRLIWSKNASPSQLWTISANGAVETQATLANDAGPIVSSFVDPLDRLILLRNEGNSARLQTVNQDGSIARAVDNGPYDGWDPVRAVMGSNKQPHILWDHSDGVAADWNMTTGVNYIGDSRLGPVTAARAAGIAVAPDNTQRLLWTGLNGSAQIWTLGVNSQFVSATSFNPVQAWTPYSIAVGPDGITHMLRVNTFHHARIWTVSDAGAVISDITVVPKGDWQPVNFAIGPDNNYRVLFYGPAGALVEIVNAAGTVLSAHVYAAPQ